MKENLRSTSPANLVVFDMEGRRGAGSQLVSAFERATKLKPPRSKSLGDSMVAFFNVSVWYGFRGVTIVKRTS